MSGRATLTTVMSSSSMNVATQTVSRVHHLRSMWRARLAGRGQCGLVATPEAQAREARDVPRWLWEQLRADPARAPEHIALAAGDVHGPSAARWMAERHAARRRAPGTHARDAVRRHVHLARASGAATGLGGWTTMALDLAGLAWIQSRLVFFVAAAFGRDSRDPLRPAGVLV